MSRSLPIPGSVLGTELSRKRRFTSTQTLASGCKVDDIGAQKAMSSGVPEAEGGASWVLQHKGSQRMNLQKGGRGLTSASERM